MQLIDQLVNKLIQTKRGETNERINEKKIKVLRTDF